MQMRSGVVGLLLGTTLACGGRGREQRIDAVKQDEEVLRKVTTVVNQVVRNAGDCEAVKASLPEARQRLNEAAAEIKEEGSRKLLGALRDQVDRATEACP